MSSSTKSKSHDARPSIIDQGRTSEVSIQIPLRSQSDAMLPPPVPSSQRQPRSSSKRAASPSNDDSNPDSQSSSRKWQSTSEHLSSSELSSRFSDRIKRQIKSESPGNRCWHCGGEGRDVAHVMPGRQETEFKDLQSVGLTSLGSLRQKENGFLLCQLCHGAFDKLPCPDWTFFPTDLGFFIKQERIDYRRRVKLCKEGSRNPIPIRQSPTATIYFQHQKDTGGSLFPGARWGTYTSYVIKAFGPAGREFPKGYRMTKIWHGDPLIALRHSFASLIRHFLDMPKELKQLSEAYAVHDDTISRLATDPTATIEDESDDDDNDDDDDDDDNDGSSGPRDDIESVYKGKGNGKESSRGNALGPQNAGQAAKRHSARIENQARGRDYKQRGRTDPAMEVLVMLSPFGKPIMQDEPYAKTVPCKRPYDTVYGGKWAFGPGATAQSAIDQYRLGLDMDEAAEKRVPDTPQRTRVEQGLLTPRRSKDSNR
ncbi:MAG: hypothetical protein Q9219_007722 [cf. Caloplaca sp. 3 TL-2023]